MKILKREEKDFSGGRINFEDFAGSPNETIGHKYY